MNQTFIDMKDYIFKYGLTKDKRFEKTNTKFIYKLNEKAYITLKAVMTTVETALLQMYNNFTLSEISTQNKT